MTLKLTDKDYLLEHYIDLQFACKGNVQKVRDYLEQECGFKKSDWSTDKYLDLHWLSVGVDGYVHGTKNEKGSSTRTQCDIYYLIDVVDIINNGYKPIKLK